jgi:succinoglycan biosynthesis protein ExoA
MADTNLAEGAPDGLFDDLLYVIPCLNEETHIRTVINRALNDDGSKTAPIYVVDGGSVDRTREIVAEASAKDGRVRLVDNPRRIQSAGVNLIVRDYSQGYRFLVRLDAHADYPPRFGSSLRKVAIDVAADSVVVPMRAVGDTCFQAAVAAAQNSRLSNGGSPHRIGGKSGFVDHGHHALFRIEAFAAAGGYNEQFVANEDAELDTRLTASGARIFMSAENEIAYYPRAAILALWRQYLRHGKGRSHTLQLHRRRPKLRQLLPIFVAPAVALALLAPVFPLFAAPLMIWAGACLSYGGYIGARTRNLCNAASGIAAMTMHLAWSVGYWQGRLNPYRPI